jgi:hypothetical protein
MNAAGRGRSGRPEAPARAAPARADPPDHRPGVDHGLTGRQNAVG